MALLFIPVTTLSLNTLKGREIGEGAAFTGMMRQPGESFRIAPIPTFRAQQTAIHPANISSHLDITNPAVQNHVTGVTNGLMAKGIPSNNAQLDTYKLMGYSVTKQAMVLSYMAVFLYIGLMFLICVHLYCW
ncbi:MAG: hypothetical protein H7Y86_04910 [Rhizobacter sp.]|nr:hypothetical protein [Ferruginibacter sp.]